MRALKKIKPKNINKLVNDLKKCRICFSPRLYKFLDLGEMPIPNGFLNKNDLRLVESKFELSCLFCQECGLVQLSKVVNPNLMFKNYVYIPSGARVMMNNFSNLSYQIYKRLKLNDKSLVIDIGSNDGSLLTFFKSYGTKVLGIDPAANLAKLAVMRGIPTETKLFNLNSAKNISTKYGKADAIVATNVIAHIDNLHSVLQGVSHLLSENGLFVSEFPYFLDLIKKNEFDTIYHEHLSYFALRPWARLIENYGFEIESVQRLQIHGGSLRITHKRRSSKKSTHRNHTVKYLISLENKYNIYSVNSLDEFAQNVENLKFDLLRLLRDLKKKGKMIVGYGAAAKGNVLTNYFGIGNNLLDYIVDSTPYKQGLFTPGKHIPVFSEKKLLEDKPDYALILAWNFADEIVRKEKEFRKKGGKFIIPIPAIKII